MTEPAVPPPNRSREYDLDRVVEMRHRGARGHRAAGGCDRMQQRRELEGRRARRAPPRLRRRRAGGDSGCDGGQGERLDRRPERCARKATDEGLRRSALAGRPQCRRPAEGAGHLPDLERRQAEQAPDRLTPAAAAGLVGRQQHALRDALRPTRRSSSSTRSTVTPGSCTRSPAARSTGSTPRPTGSSSSTRARPEATDQGICGDQFDLYVSKLDGSGAKRITSDGLSAFPVWGLVGSPSRTSPSRGAASPTAARRDRDDPARWIESQDRGRPCARLDHAPGFYGFQPLGWLGQSKLLIGLRSDVRHRGRRARPRHRKLRRLTSWPTRPRATAASPSATAATRTRSRSSGSRTATRPHAPGRLLPRLEPLVEARCARLGPRARASRPRRRRGRRATRRRRAARSPRARSRRPDAGRPGPAGRRRPAGAGTPASPGARDRAQAVVPREPSADPRLQPAVLEVALVVDDEHRVRLELVEARRRADRAARVVHVGLGLQQRDPRGRRSAARPACRRTSRATSRRGDARARRRPASRRCGGCARTRGPDCRARRRAGRGKSRARPCAREAHRR